MQVYQKVVFAVNTKARIRDSVTMFKKNVCLYRCVHEMLTACQFVLK